MKTLLKLMYDYRFTYFLVHAPTPLTTPSTTSVTDNKSSSWYGCLTIWTHTGWFFHNSGSSAMLELV